MHPQLGLWATIYKESGKLIGRCGLLPWTIDGQPEIEVAYLTNKAYWGQGLGTEAAIAILDYGFDLKETSPLSLANAASVIRSELYLRQICKASS